MKKKVLPVIVAILLILVIGGCALGKVLLDKYSYSKEEADWNEFYQVSENDRSAIILQNEMVEEQALIKDGVCYFDLATVHKYMNEVFYADMTENLLLYATPTEVIRTTFGETAYTTTEGTQEAGYVISFADGDNVYVAADYVKLFTNYSYECYDRHVQVNTEWGTRQVAQLKKDTAVRLRGGVKSPILTQAVKGDTLEILEQMETWSKVKTADAVIGYVENKRLAAAESQKFSGNFTAPVYKNTSMSGKIVLGWHQVTSQDGNNTFDSIVAKTKGMNVISPTWFSLTDNNGNYRSLASKDYVVKAHAKGLQVWALIDNFSADVQTETLLASTATRRRLIDSLIADVEQYGLDGLNLDFESLKADAGVHYIEFIRELSIPCRQKGIILSVDNYVPARYNSFYNLKEQGTVADYVIMMGYDEHFAGGEPGSVSSISYVKNGISGMLEDVPKEKLINAVPFYTRLWIEAGDGSITSKAMGIADAKKWVETNQVELTWQADTAQYYGEKQTSDGAQFLWMEEERSLKEKMNVVRQNDLAGVACWKLGFEDSAAWDSIQWN